MMFCHRFYMWQSHAKNDWQASYLIMLAAQASLYCCRFSVSFYQDYEDVIQQMMHLWEHSQSQTLALKDKKVIESQIKKATTTTSNCEKKEALKKAYDTFRETANLRTGETCSGISVVEDGDIVVPVTVKSDLSSSYKTVSVGANSMIVDVNKIKNKQTYQVYFHFSVGSGGKDRHKHYPYPSWDIEVAPKESPAQDKGDVSTEDYDKDGADTEHVYTTEGCRNIGKMVVVMKGT
ncbi:hypothetical protein R6Q59_010521 [Mikania micrantha]